MKAIKQTELDYNLWTLITQVADIMLMARESEVKPYGITAVQTKVLGIITYHKKPVRVSELSKRLQRKPNGVTALIDRMKKDDLVYESDETESKKKRIIGITEKGKKIYEETRDIIIISKILSHLTKNQKEQLIKTLLMVRGDAIKELHAHTFYL